MYIANIMESKSEIGIRVRQTKTPREIINRFWLVNQSLFHLIEINMARNGISDPRDEDRSIQRRPGRWTILSFLSRDPGDEVKFSNPEIRHVACFMKYRLKFKLFQSYICTVVLSKWVELKVFLSMTISVFVTDLRWRQSVTVTDI